MRRAYRAKCDAMLGAIDEFMPDSVKATRPLGGLYVWLTLPEGVATGADSALFETALRDGVLYVPGEFFYPGDEETPAETNHLRLSFSVGAPERIREGIKRLAAAIRKVCGK